MKYAKEVIELLASYPGKEFRMAQIVRHVSRGMPLTPARRNAVRQGVLRVLSSLEDSGQVEKSVDAPNSVYYSWCRKVRHEVDANRYAICDNRGGQVAPVGFVSW